MAVETEMYVVFPEDFLESNKVCPAIVTTDLEVVRSNMDILQGSASATKMMFRVIQVTEAEFMYKITPEAMAEDEEVDEDLMTQIGNILNQSTNAPF